MDFTGTIFISLSRSNQTLFVAIRNERLRVTRVDRVRMEFKIRQTRKLWSLCYVSVHNTKFTAMRNRHK